MTNGKTAPASPELKALLEDWPDISLTDAGNIFQEHIREASSSD
jgi:hypothetical protein